MVYSALSFVLHIVGARLDKGMRGFEHFCKFVTNLVYDVIISYKISFSDLIFVMLCIIIIYARLYVFKHKIGMSKPNPARRARK